MIIEYESQDCRLSSTELSKRLSTSEVIGLRFLYSEFAYSTHMQVLLAAVTFVETFLTMYMLSNVIMDVFKMKLSIKQRLLFTFINGSLLQTALIYGIYILGGMLSFSPFVYLVVVNVNPASAMIYYYTALRIFRLSNERSVKMMSYMLIFWAIKVTAGKLLHVLFYIESGPRYNYLMDAVQQISALVLFFLLYKSMLYILEKTQASLRFTDNMFFNKRKELVIYILEAMFLFCASVIVPSIVTDQVAAHVIVILLSLLYTVVSICADIVAYNKQVISNRDAHIGALFRGMEDLRGVKHDFNNILQAYSGYLELKEYEKLERYHASLVLATSHAGSITELAHRMQENPPFISLLISKIECAEQLSVKMLVSVKCNLEQLYIDNMDITRILAHLLDNALEAANLSQQRRVYVTIGTKANRSKLIIVANSVADSHARARPPERRDSDTRILKVRDIMKKYGNCSLQMEYRDQEVSAYVELRSTK